MKKELVSMRPHIGIFGRRNAGKSSLINALTGQNAAIVSETPGTTTDPVGRAMEILPLGPVFIVDTAGLDDFGELGEKRVKKSMEVLGRTDLIILVSSSESFGDIEREFAERIEKTGEKILVVFSKSDIEIRSSFNNEYLKMKNIPYIYVSSRTKENISELRNKLAEMLPEVITSDVILRDLVGKDDIVVQVIPIDSAAPKGRVILPQEQALRDALDSHSISVVVQTGELASALKILNKKPSLVVTDSQAIEEVGNITPENIPLTTYSILFSRLKGDLNIFVKGLSVLNDLKDGDKIFIAEACTHHPQPDDIGRYKLPKWIEGYTGKKLEFIVNPGKMIHQDMSDAKLIIHCGGCMINRKEVLQRISAADEKMIPITNYGVIISHIHNQLRRTIRMFPETYRTYKEMFGGE